MKNKLLITGFIILLALSSIALAKDYPGIGVMTCGDLWESFMPSAINKYYSESKTDVTRCFVLMRSGNFERQWTTPTTMYPSGADFHMPWSQNFMMSEYSHEAINNYYTDADERNPFYANAFWLESMANAGGVSTNADQHGGVPWADDGRLSMVYEVAMPTNLGIDVKMRVRGFTLNEANMNDWLAMELELTNTGVQDVNCDGEVDRENHKIEALSLGMATEVIGSIRNNVKGNRKNASWLKSRMIGYDATPDPDGNPWALGFAWGSNNNPADIGADGWAPDENRYVGYRHGQSYPQDIFDGWQYIAVKQGGMDGGSAAADKKTIYDSHGIGEGTERGWYTTFNRTMASQRTGYANFLAATGTWYEDGGRTWQWDQLTNMKPDPNYFDQSGTFTAGDPLSFVNVVKPEGQRGRPNGDMKQTGSWYQNWEKNYPGTPAPQIPEEDQWLVGGTPPTYQNFDGDRFAGCGPFSLEVGETMTVVLVEFAGYRLQGARQSIKSARWAYENDWNIPQPPPMPDMLVRAVQLESGEFKNKIVWDNAAESAGDFAGYKIYRVTAFPNVDFQQLGIRFISNYHHQTASDIGATYDELAAAYSDPMNPNWSVPATYNLEWNADPSGPWTIMAHITNDQLAAYANEDDDAGTYPYAWVDTGDDVLTGYTYWYYVAAFDSESGEMAGVSFTSLESGKDNWNGRSGTWMGTYHYATGATEFPTVDVNAKKDIGAAHVLKPARVDNTELLSGAKTIGVTPNPYKVQAPHDVGLEHKVQFFNLTSDTRITILDLSGQVMDVLEYEGTDPTDGSVFWDMFTKDGPEVASGLYIWIAEYPGGSQKGYLGIQR
jgi:hypothetical protein